MEVLFLFSCDQNNFVDHRERHSQRQSSCIDQETQRNGVTGQRSPEPKKPQRVKSTVDEAASFVFNGNDDFSNDDWS